MCIENIGLPLTGADSMAVSSDSTLIPAEASTCVIWCTSPLWSSETATAV